MLKKLAGIIDRVATVRMLVVLTLLSILFPIVVFPATGLGDVMPLDLYLSYSPGQAYEYLGALGDNGRIAYARMELTTDLVFPVVYSLGLAVALRLVARKLHSSSRLQPLCLFPMLIVIADWCENLSLAGVIHDFPVRHDVIVNVASFFTSLKWTLIILVVMTLFITGAFVVRKQLLDKQGG